MLSANIFAKSIWKDLARVLIRYLIIIIIALLVFAIILQATGKNPIKAYQDTISIAFGTSYGFSELFVKMSPLILTAVAVALPSRMGLINIGGEGQLFMGALFATWGALTFPSLPQAVLLPFMVGLGFLDGGLWAAIPAIMRAKGWVPETISTLLLNYVAPLVVSFYIFGAWRSADSASFPQTDSFVDAARLPTFGDVRAHWGLLIGLASLIIYWLFITRSRWGLEIRAIGGNREASRHIGISINKYIIFTMMVAGGIAGLAGMAQVSGVEGRLGQHLSPGFGFVGFLISWLTGGHPVGIVVMALLFALITTGGNVLQITQNIPFAVVNILMALILYVVLAQPTWKGKGS